MTFKREKLPTSLTPKSDFSEVLTTLSKEELLEDSPLNLAALAGSYASAGKRSEARRVIAKLNAISSHRYVCPYELGTAHAALGETDQAIASLQKAYRIRSSCVPDLKTDPRLKTLRKDPRFQELLDNLRFP